MSNQETLWQLVGEIYPFSTNLRDLGVYTLPEALKDAALHLFVSGEGDTTRAIEVRAALRTLREKGTLP